MLELSSTEEEDIAADGSSRVGSFDSDLKFFHEFSFSLTSINSFISEVNVLEASSLTEGNVMRFEAANFSNVKGEELQNVVISWLVWALIDWAIEDLLFVSFYLI